MKTGIIGCGITGLTAAYELSKNGQQVELFEAAEAVGGIAEAVQLDGFYLEKYYHHFFKSDEHIIALLEELGLGGRLLWRESRMGYYTGGRAYEFGTPQSLLQFKPLPVTDKFRFGVSVLKLMGIKAWQPMENVTAKDWLLANAGAKAFETVWKPLLVTKFGEQYDRISMAWLWGKIRLRGTSKENGRELLGYIDGSSSLLFERLTERLKHNDVKINLSCRVEAIKKDSDGFTLELQQCRGEQCSPYKGNKSFDRIIAAVPLPVFGQLAESILQPDYIEKINTIEHTSVVCMVLMLKKPFGRFYWLNIGDESIPFGGLIEHTNLMDKSLYNNKNILYISNYLYKSSKYYGMSSGELLKEYIPYLKQINPEFDESWIESSYTFKDEYAQPVIKCGYSKLKPGFETTMPGLYTAGMCNIYPEDRGMNYAVRDGKAVAACVMG
ncbi:MAG TPA: NAD(P)/FAD-dependent oxidoreductase [Clostridia bacterium]|nr:NAD(P)/FAD-dependent oxidoreductase [Clostridia bacterium]